MGDRVMGVEAKLASRDRSPQIAQLIEKTLGGPPYRVMDWYELNKKLFMAVFGERRP